MRLWCLGPILCLCVSLTAQASDNTISPITYDALNRAQVFLQEEQYPEAQKTLDSLVNQLNPGFGLALTHQLYGQFWLAQEEPERAIIAFGDALALAVFAPPQEAAILTNMAQIQLSLNDAPAALLTLLKPLSVLLDTEAAAQSERGSSRIVQPPALITLATALQMEARFAESIPYVLLALDRSESVRESWLRMLMVAYYKENEYELAAQVLDRLVAINPDREEYWQQQASMYQLLERIDLALRTLELGYVGGYVQHPDSIRMLVQLLIAEGVPERAARVLADAFKQGSLAENEPNWRLLAAAWQQGRDRRMAAHALRAAAAHTQDGVLLLRAAQLHAQDAHHDDVIVDVTHAIARGLVDDDHGRALILAANAAYALHDIGLARRYYQQALRFAGVAATAREWLNYIALLDAKG